MAADLPDGLVRYEGHGVRFEYPGCWELVEEADGGDVVLTVSGDGTCFWTLRILGECPRPEDVLNSCISAFQEEYDDAEVSDTSPHFADMPARGRELSFSCFELLNSVSLTCVRTTGMTLLNWWQGTDHELDQVRAVFEQMTQSVRIVAL